MKPRASYRPVLSVSYVLLGPGPCSENLKAFLYERKGDSGVKGLASVFYIVRDGSGMYQAVLFPKRTCHSLRGVAEQWTKKAH